MDDETDHLKAFKIKEGESSSWDHRIYQRLNGAWVEVKPARPSGSKINPDLRQGIIDAHGDNATSVGKRFGVDKNVVVRIWTSVGLPLRQRGRPKSPGSA